MKNLFFYNVFDGDKTLAIKFLKSKNKKSFMSKTKIGGRSLISKLEDYVNPELNINDIFEDFAAGHTRETISKRKRNLKRMYNNQIAEYKNWEKELNQLSKILSKYTDHINNNYTDEINEIVYENEKFELI